MADDTIPIKRPTVAIPDLCDFARRVLVFLSMRIEFSFTERFYRILERIAVSVDSIDQTLKAPPEDFTDEDQTVVAATQAVHDAQERIPH